MEQTIEETTDPIERKRKKKRRNMTANIDDASCGSLQDSTSVERDSSVVTCGERDEEVSLSSTRSILPLDMKLSQIQFHSPDAEQENNRGLDSADAQSDSTNLCTSSEICTVQDENKHDNAPLVRLNTNRSLMTNGRRKRKRAKKLKSNTSLLCPDVVSISSSENKESVADLAEYIHVDHVLNVPISSSENKESVANLAEYIHVAHVVNVHIKETNGPPESKVPVSLCGSCPARSQPTTASNKDETSDNASVIDNLEEKIVELPVMSSDNASKDYLRLQKSLTMPANLRKKLLILDLNGLLADIVLLFSDEFKPDTKISGKAVFKRPFCDDFLQFCFERFDVGVWSSRTRRNVDQVVSFLMGSAKEKLIFCWDQSYCTQTGYHTIGNQHKPLLLKELDKLWSKQEPCLPWEMGDYNESNTLLLDDSPYKALRNPPHTAIFPYPYEHKDIDDRILGPGGNLRIYLERLAAADNVQTFVHDNPFGQGPITESNSSWAFYAKIVGSDEDKHGPDTTQASASL
ncbi:hypothetical protein Dimus_024032 [Dionaea muscipula]